MKILIHCVHYPVASGRYAADALKRLGHDVRHVGVETGREIWGMTVPEKYVWKAEPPEDGWEPDLCILMDTAYQWCHPTIPTVVWSVDNHVRNLRQPGILHYFLAHHDGPTHPVRLPDETWLPCAYDPTLHTPSQIPYKDRDFDVAMIGFMYPQRAELVSELKAAGLKVYWGLGLLGQDYVAAYHNARISLCVSAAGDVAQRVFETAAMGCLVISDDCADFERLKAYDVGIANFHEGDAVAGWCRDFVDDPEKAQEFIALSLEWVKPHTWDARAQVIIAWLEKQQAGEAFYATSE